MIELITNGALPKPAKCLSCGYGGADRYYFRFAAYMGKAGQVLLCTARPDSEDQTGCMNEASRAFPVSFIERTAFDLATRNNAELRGQLDRLTVASNRFTDDFAALVSRFLSDVVEPTSASKILESIENGGATH